MSGTVLRLVVAIVCLVGIVLGGALAPAIGVSTPVPDLGVESGEGESVGGGLLVGGGAPPDSTTADGRASGGAESGTDGADAGSGSAGATGESGSATGESEGAATGSEGATGGSGSASAGSGGAGGEFVEDVETTEGGVPVESGTRSYGGVSSGGYPRESSIGGPLSLSDQVELRIESPEPSRWRLGAYANYTGSGWEIGRAHV